MPDDRPMPLTGEEKIPTHPVLGEPLDNFPSRRLRPLLTGWSFLIGASLLFNLATYNIDTTAYGPAIAIGFGVVALAIGWWIMHLWNREVILYERGFTYREGSKDVPFLYEELATIRLRAEQLAYFGGLLRRVDYEITMRTHAGDVIQLTNIYRRVEQLGERLNVIVTDNQRPVVQRALNGDDTVKFAAELKVGRVGIIISAGALEAATEDAVLPWAGFGGYNIAQRQLNLLQADGRLWYNLPLSEIDNLLLLLVVLRQHTTEEGISP